MTREFQISNDETARNYAASAFDIYVVAILYSFDFVIPPHSGEGDAFCPLH
jgi:hypothetical protein